MKDGARNHATLPRDSFEAQRRFETEDEWWREHRDAKDLFVDEFEWALTSTAFGNYDILEANR